MSHYSEFYSILSAIKRCFSRSPVHKAVLKVSLCPDSSGPRGGKRYICSVCGQPYGIREVQVDHKDPIVPVGTLSKDMSWDNIISRVFCSADNLQVLCSTCHKAKSHASENKERIRFRKHTKQYLDEFQGNMYGRLLVLDHHSYSPDGFARALCECDCGNLVVVQYNNLKSGHSQSCGCLRGTHHLSGTKEHKCWQNIKSRCYNPNSTGFRYYGGRGIYMDDSWLDSFDKFLSDVGICPEDKDSLDRIDVNGPYTKDNCRWATHREQGNNRTNNTILEWDSESKTLQHWAECIGIKPNTLLYRLRRGWPLGEALGFESRSYSHYKSKEENMERKEEKRKRKSPIVGDKGA